jgi:hypothetical protein
MQPSLGTPHAYGSRIWQLCLSKKCSTSPRMRDELSSLIPRSWSSEGIARHICWWGGQGSSHLNTSCSISTSSSRKTKCTRAALSATGTCCRYLCCFLCLLSVFSSICLSVYFFVCLPIFLLINLSICLSNFWSSCLSFCLSACFVCLTLIPTLGLVRGASARAPGYVPSRHALRQQR